MIPAKVENMRCSKCKEDLDTCSDCFIVFNEDEMILCENEKTGSHYCLKCKK
jgi:hypothetical protein